MREQNYGVAKIKSKEEGISREDLAASTYKSAIYKAINKVDFGYKGSITSFIFFIGTEFHFMFEKFSQHNKSIRHD